MANKRPHTFTQVGAITDDFELYNQPASGAEEKATAAQLVPYLESKGVTDKYHVHSQATPSTTWAVTHNFGRTPNTLTRNNSGLEIKGEIQVVDLNNINILFNQAVTGTAYLS